MKQRVHEGECSHADQDWILISGIKIYDSVIYSLGCNKNIRILSNRMVLSPFLNDANDICRSVSFGPTECAIFSKRQ